MRVQPQATTNIPQPQENASIYSPFFKNKERNNQWSRQFLDGTSDTSISFQMIHGWEDFLWIFFPSISLNIHIYVWFISVPKKSIKGHHNQSYHSPESIMVYNICQNNLIRSFQYYKVDLNREPVLDYQHQKPSIRGPKNVTIVSDHGFSWLQQQGFHHETNFEPAVEKLAKCVKPVLSVCQAFDAAKC